MQDTQLDNDAVDLSKAIRQTESGGNFQAKGKSGEYGAYQFTSPTWDSYSKKHGVNVPLEQATPSQQNEVAYKQIKEWKDQGYNVGQIASMWNSGKPDAYKDTEYKGKNKYGVSYDVPAYAKSVATAYQTIKSGGNVSPDPQNPSSVSQGRQTFESQVGSIPSPTEPQSGTLGTNPGDSMLAKLTDNSITRGLVNLVPGASTLGKSIGTLGGLAYEKAKGLLGGQDNSKEYDISDAPSVGKTALAGAEYASNALIPKAITGIGGLLKGGSTLAKPEIAKILEGAIGKGETISSLSRQEAVNTLGNYLKEMSVSEAGGKTEQLILKALKELNPTLIEKQNILSKLVKGGFNLASNAALVNFLGGKVGGLIHQSIQK